ncbi:shikimate dehydrogenase [Helicobacter didelphidarum]|nr:shikimate dehydrogenase [Helicobacter didelphidarum]
MQHSQDLQEISSATQKFSIAPRLFGVIGNPITHSLSPKIHNYAIKNLTKYLKQYDFYVSYEKQYNQIANKHTHTQYNELYDNTYSEFPLNPIAFYTHFALPLSLDSQGLRDFLLQSDLDGINITLPFKEIAYEAATEVRGIAKEIQAVNTLVREGENLIGYNTDAEGFYLCIESYKPKKVLLLGAGGSAKSIAIILSHYKIPFCVANRSVEKLDFFQRYAETKSFATLIDEVRNSQNNNKNNVPQYDVIVNATSAGITHNLPLPKDILRVLLGQSTLAFDLMYQQDGLTTFCTFAKDCNKKFLDGKNMLVYQAAIAFQYFHRLDFHTDSLQVCNDFHDKISTKSSSEDSHLLDSKQTLISLQDIISLMNEALGIC